MKLMKVLEKLRFASSSIVYRSLSILNNKITDDTRFMEFWWELVRDGRIVLTIREAYNIYFYLSVTLPLGGSVAELGVYRGGGAKLISEFKSDLPLYLFDTFQGMPAVNDSLDLHREGDFSDTSLEDVQNYLRGYSNCFFHRGFFPDTTLELPENLEFCFVHLDVDIYDSTLSGLEFFYPRLKKGGVLISHDYNSISCPGVKRAFDKYFIDKDEEVRYLWDTQCMIKKKSGLA